MLRAGAATTSVLQGTLPAENKPGMDSQPKTNPVWTLPAENKPRYGRSENKPRYGRSRYGRSPVWTLPVRYPDNVSEIRFPVGTFHAQPENEPVGTLHSLSPRTNPVGTLRQPENEPVGTLRLASW